MRAHVVAAVGVVEELHRDVVVAHRHGPVFHADVAALALVDQPFLVVVQPAARGFVREHEPDPRENAQGTEVVDARRGEPIFVPKRLA